MVGKAQACSLQHASPQWTRLPLFTSIAVVKTLLYNNANQYKVDNQEGQNGVRSLYLIFT